jgi:hypothetical protein
VLAHKEKLHHIHSPHLPHTVTQVSGVGSLEKAQTLVRISLRCGLACRQIDMLTHCYHGSTDCLPQEANTGTRVPNNPHHQPTISYFALLKLPQTLSLKPSKILQHTSHNHEQGNCNISLNSKTDNRHYSQNTSVLKYSVIQV